MQSSIPPDRVPRVTTEVPAAVRQTLMPLSIGSTLMPPLYGTYLFSSPWIWKIGFGFSGYGSVKKGVAHRRNSSNGFWHCGGQKVAKQTAVGEAGRIEASTVNLQDGFKIIENG
jgi:hypothetical protein